MAMAGLLRGLRLPARPMISRTITSSILRHIKPNPHLLRYNHSHELSDEQKLIVATIKHSNVVVSACPGSGKSNTALQVAREHPDVLVEIVTFSKALEQKTTKDIAEAGLHNARCMTFHALAGELSGLTIKNDTDIYDLRRKKTPLNLKRLPGIVVFDEVQDCNAHIYWLTAVYLAATRRRGLTAPKVLILGDQRQAIHEWRGADARYMEHAQKFWQDLSPYKWEQLELTKSFRLSKRNAEFVNLFTGDSSIVGHKEKSMPKPLYIHADTSKLEAIAEILRPLIKKYGPENCAVLAPSLRNHHGDVPKFINALSSVNEPNKDEILIYVPPSEQIVIGDELKKVTEGRLVVSTFHQFKGMERKFIIVLGADSSYFDMAKDLPDDVCPNPVYVALTRAKEQLAVIHSHKKAFMGCVQYPDIMEACDLINLVDGGPKAYIPRAQTFGLSLLLPSRPMAVPDAIRHLPEDTIRRLSREYMQIDTLSSDEGSENVLNVPATVKIRDDPVRHELVSHLNGPALLAAFEWMVSRTCNVLGHSVEKHAHKLPEKGQPQAWWFTKKAAWAESWISQFRPRYDQLKDHFGWLRNLMHLQPALQRLGAQFGDTSIITFAHQVKHKVMVKGDSAVTLTACLHVVESSRVGRPNILWEIKFAKSLHAKDALQLVIMGYLWTASRRAEGLHCDFPDLSLFNIQTGGKQRILTTFEKAERITKESMIDKYSRLPRDESEELLFKECTEIRKEALAHFDKSEP